MGNKVYFLHNPKTNEIKIGQTGRFRRRIRDLERAEGCKLRLLAIIDAPLIERELHGKFAHIRTRGEWFRSTDELRDFIATLKSVTVEDVPPAPWYVRAMCLVSAVCFLVSGVGYGTQLAAGTLHPEPGFEWLFYVMVPINFASAVGMFRLYELGLSIRGDAVTHKNGHGVEIVE
jgi:hypothetical protein